MFTFTLLTTVYWYIRFVYIHTVNNCLLVYSYTPGFALCIRLFILVLERSTPATSGVLDYDAFDAKVFDYSNVLQKDNSLSRAMVRQSNVFEKYTSTHSSPEVSKSVNNSTIVKKLSLHEEANIHHLMRSISEDQGRRPLYRSYDGMVQFVYLTLPLLFLLCKGFFYVYIRFSTKAGNMKFHQGISGEN